MPTIFISYSHQDVGLVQPVVRLLRATDDIVFQDVDSIAPGRKWQREIEEALSAAETFVLFWCYHSSRSAEVRAEYQWVLAVGKDVLPVLLDGTPLPAPLNEFQWVDFRHFVGTTHRSSRRWLTRTVAVVLIAGLVSFATYSFRPPTSVPTSQYPPPITAYPEFPPSPDPGQSPLDNFLPPPPDPVEPPVLPLPDPLKPPVPPPPVPVDTAPPKVLGFLWLFGLVLIATLATLGALVIRRVRQGRRSFSMPQRPQEAPQRREASSPQEQMAEQIQAELFRRGIGSA